MLIERLRRALAPHYEVLDQVGEGGMGIVYSGRQVRLNRTVAIKLLRPELATAVAAERFKSEGQILALLDHPSIVPIYDADEKDGLFYYVMKFVEGETLAERLERGPLPPAEARSLAVELLGALGMAHAKDVVHRDVKPANIFLQNGLALLGDFGIARGRDAALTATGDSPGTLLYMAPEQMEGLPATPRTDVYAAGLVLWEACIGKRWPRYQSPEQGDWSRIPDSMTGLLQRALALAPEDRFASAVEAGAALQPEDRFATAVRVGAVVQPEAARARRWRYLVLVGAIAYRRADPRGPILRRSRRARRRPASRFPHEHIDRRASGVSRPSGSSDRVRPLRSGHRASLRRHDPDR